MAGTTGVREFDTFSFEAEGAVGLFTFHGRALFLAADRFEMEPLASAFRECTDDPALKVIVIRRAPDQKDADDYGTFVRQITASGNPTRLHRMLNFFSRLILEVYNDRRFVLSVDSGTVVAQFFNVSLACDYRLVADDTVLQKEYFHRGVVPKGGATWFLSRLVGKPAAYRILLSEKEVTAAEALALGLVDEVVPRARLDEAVLERARAFAAVPDGTLFGTKALMNHGADELERYLAFESEVIAKIYAKRGPLT